MFRDTTRRSNNIPGFGKTNLWRNGITNPRGIDNFVSPPRAKIKSPKDLSSSAFKVYDRVLERHRYVPRKWTQEEFEAALPERFSGKPFVSAQNSEVDFHKPNLNIDELNFDKESDVPAENTGKHIPSCSNHQGKAEIKEKIKNLKAIFEQTAKINGVCKTSGIVDRLERSGRSEIQDKATDELERCKDSEAKVKLIDEGESGSNCNENEEIVDDISEKASYNTSETTKTSNKEFPNFVEAFIRCLLNSKPFLEMPLNVSQDNTVITMLKQWIEHPRQFVSEESFLKLWRKVSECQNSDEILEMLLETLVGENGQRNGEQAVDLRSLVQGEFCHIKTCDCCSTTDKYVEPFLFLNPKTPASCLSKKSALDVNFLSCGSEGFWHIATRHFLIKPGMMVAHIVDELLRSPEFHGCDSMRIGEVEEGRLVRRLSNDAELPILRSTSNLFAFNVMNFSDEFVEGGAISSTGMPSHLYFHCGLCLSDGKEVCLFMHKSCGGMLCRDCLDVITQSYHEWEPCPCPICEQSIDLDKDLCKARMDRPTTRELSPTSTTTDRFCEIMFRAGNHIDGGSELFGCPLIASIPSYVTGYHLYRCIGYLLPNALPMKDKTSFTLHTVNSSGQSCSSCSLESCKGCLIRIDDNIRIKPDTNFVVHFDDLAEESKKNFGISNARGISDANSQGFFDRILQSCVTAATRGRMVCSKCTSACKVSSSIAEFPQLLLIHLNQLYADEGLASNTSISDVSRFLVVQHGDDSAEKKIENLTYQLTAVVLTDESSMVPSHKALLSEFDADRWMLHEDSHVSEIDPCEINLTINSVLFYQAVRNSDPPKVEQVLRMPVLGRREDTLKVSRGPFQEGNNIYDRKLATISEETGRRIGFRKTNKKQDLYSDRQFEPGEYLMGTGYGSTDVHSSQLSLGEIAQVPYLPPRLSVDFDGISPISAQQMYNRDSKMLHETNKLIEAVKQEDAHAIVNALKYGANPCLLINDVSALHLAAGIKSEQRCSTVAYLLKYSNDVNIATADGTTPLHVAAAWDHQDALELLLKHGGDAFDLTDQEGNSAFDLASKKCSSFLQILYQTDRGSPAGQFAPSTSSKDSLANEKPKRLEDIVRCNVTLPSFVNEEDTNRSRRRFRWLERFRSFRNKSTGVFKNLKRMSSVRRRSRIGVIRQDNEQGVGNNVE